MNKDQILRLRAHLASAREALSEIRSIMEYEILPDDKANLAELAKVDASLLAIERKIAQLDRGGFQ